MRTILLILLLSPLFAFSQTFTVGLVQSLESGDGQGSDLELQYYYDVEEGSVYGLTGVDINDSNFNRFKVGLGTQYNLFPEARFETLPNLAIYYDGDVNMRAGINFQYEDIPIVSGLLWDSSFNSLSLLVSYKID